MTDAQIDYAIDHPNDGREIAPVQKTANPNAIVELASMIARRINFLQNDPQNPAIIFIANDEICFNTGDGTIGTNYTTATALESVLKNLIAYLIDSEQKHFEEFVANDGDPNTHIYSEAQFVYKLLFK